MRNSGISRIRAANRAIPVTEAHLYTDTPILVQNHHALTASLAGDSTWNKETTKQTGDWLCSKGCVGCRGRCSHDARGVIA